MTSAALRASAAIVVLALGVMLAWPIVAEDQDLWFHLAHGRQIADTGSLPTDAWFSFVGPRAYLDYSWLFQFLVHGIQRASGWVGLIVFRALLFAAVLVACSAWLHGDEKGRGERLLAAVATGLYLLALFPRVRVVRPHDFGFLMIPVLMLLLERGGRRQWLVPLLALLWTNVHGVSWPILAAISGAWLTERVFARMRGESPARVQDILAPVLAIAATFCTPHGIRLVTLPFTSTRAAAHYISELSPTDWGSLLHVGVAGLFVDWHTARLSVLLLAAGGAWIAVRERPLRVAHLVVGAGGVLLFARGLRFQFEALLLLLPLVSRVTSRSFDVDARVANAVGSLCIIVPGVVMLSVLDQQGRWPLARTDLPVGSAAYLAAQSPGRVMNHPDDGGYLAHALAPPHRIFADMEAPFPFSDEDIFIGVNAFASPEVFAAVVGQWRPSWLLVPRRMRTFPDVKSGHPQYRPVFFDDVSVVFVDADQHPTVAARDELHVLDPFDPRLPDDEDRGRIEIERLLAIDPEGAILNALAARASIRAGDPVRGLERADRGARASPESAVAQEALGDARLANGDYSGARRAYRDSARAAGGSVTALLRDQSRAALAAHRVSDAYSLLLRSMNPFAPATGHRDLYELAATAVAAGRPDDARRWARFAWLKCPAEDVDAAERIRLLRVGLGDNPERL